MSGPTGSNPNFDGNNDFVDTSDDDTSPFISSHPWFWIIVPIALLAVLLAFAAWIQARRRRRFRDLSLNPSSAHGYARPGLGRRGNGGAAGVSGAPGQDEEAQGADRQHGPAPGGSPWPRPTTMNRWAWANGSPQDRPAELGLNELGEAPPPYDGVKQGPNQVHESGQVAGLTRPPQALHQGLPPSGWKAEDGEELRELLPSASIDEVGGRSSGAEASTPATPATATALSSTRSPSPPDYNSVVTGSNSGLLSPVTTPASASATLATASGSVGGAVTRPSPATLPAERASLRR